MPADESRVSEAFLLEVGGLVQRHGVLVDRAAVERLAGGLAHDPLEQPCNRVAQGGVTLPISALAERLIPFGHAGRRIQG